MSTSGERDGALPVPVLEKSSTEQPQERPASAPPAPEAPTSVTAPRLAGLLSRYGVLITFIAMFIVFSVSRSDTFLTGENLKAILIQSAPLAVVAFGLTAALVMGEFDLSFGAMAGLGGAVAITLMSVEGVDWRIAAVAAIAAGAAAGAVNGIVTAYIGASSFVITLAVGTVLTGIEYTVTGQKTIFQDIPEAYIKIGQGELLGVNYQVIVALVVFIATYVTLEKTELGRYMYAVGGNPEAAHLSGINVKRLRLIGFIIVGSCAAIAGILISAQSANSSPNAGAPLLLPAFAAAFLGSTAFRPGQFNVLGTLLGILFLGVVQNGLTLMDATPAVISIVQGALLAAAVLLVTIGGRRVRS
jgi:ribose transport system permease protein